MAKTLKFVIALAGVCGAAVLSVSAAAAAGGPKGKLTSAEYRQLSAGTTALNRSVSARSVNWSRARAACHEVGGGTDLLRTQRTSCLASLAALESLSNFPREQRQCGTRTRTGTTTTPTGTTTATSTTGTSTTGTTPTTGPAGAAVIQLLICMSPRYQALARYSRALDQGAIAARRSALARGFSGSCLAALSPTPSDLGKAKRFASSTSRLAADVSLLIKVTEGKAPSSDFNQTRIDIDVKQFETSASAVLNEHGQPRLSVCPHD